MPIAILGTVWILTILLARWVSMLKRTRQVIPNHDGEDYLYRYFIYKPADKQGGRVYLHHLVRSDFDRSLHDHPWSFVSVMLWGSYREYSTITDLRALGANGDWKMDLSDPNGEKVFADIKSPAVLYRRAQWRHRLELTSKSTWTLVFVGEKVRHWGFWCGEKWCYWKHFNYRNNVCEEPE
jgi:hypothetical protein